MSKNTAIQSRRIAVAIAMAVGISVSGAPATAAQTDAVVWCLDAARDLVTRRHALDCKGRVVDDATADEVRERRRTRIRRSLVVTPKPVARGRIAGSGTGFFITADGALVTNAHVVAGCRAVTVDAADGASAAARLIGLDAEADLALLRIETTPPAFADFAPLRDVAVDEPVALVGFPLHGKVAIRPVLVTGEVMSRPRSRPGTGHRYRLRIDVRRGNSGGPVLDGHGRVIGVIAAQVHAPRTFQATGRLVRDVGIAIAARTVFGFLESHDQTFQRTASAPPLNDEEIIARARLFVARLVCWR
jgi:S1-C subfamily serine protease